MENSLAENIVNDPEHLHAFLMRHDEVINRLTEEQRLRMEGNALFNELFS